MKKRVWLWLWIGRNAPLSKACPEDERAGFEGTRFPVSPYSATWKPAPNYDIPDGDGEGRGVAQSWVRRFSLDKEPTCALSFLRHLASNGCTVGDKIQRQAATYVAPAQNVRTADSLRNRLVKANAVIFHS